MIKVKWITSSQNNFLKTLAASIFTLALSLPAYSNEIGLQLYSLRNQMAEDLPAAIQKIDDWGIHAVEGAGNLYGYPLSEFKAMFDKHHIQIVSVDTSFEEVRDNPMAIVYKARYFGARFATFYWIPHENETFTIDDAKKGVEAMNKAGAILKANGITLQYHPHGYEFGEYKGETLLDYMLKNVTDAKFQMDVFWIKQGGADPVDFLTRYPGKFTSL
ncbi:MAG: sugar phosphate isomerase/epimerase, partial [Pseudomonadota bacterium]